MVERLGGGGGPERPSVGPSREPGPFRLPTAGSPYERKLALNHEELFALTAVNAWKQVLDRLEKGFAALSDDDLQKEVAPGKNRVLYLLGHLTAVHDRLFPMLGVGQRLHPELDDDFLSQADRSRPDRFSAAELRRAWSEVNARLTAGFEAMAPADWLLRHAAVSEEDFAREPHRNRLAVLLSRTTHAGFHAGQLVFVLPRP